MFVDVVANLIGSCMDKMNEYPAFGKSNLMQTLATDASVERSDIESLFMIEKTVERMNNNDVHPDVPKIRNVLHVIEKVSKLANSEGSAEKMEEMLQKKKHLSGEIDEYKNKQNLLILATVVFIGLWCICFCICYKKHKQEKQKDTGDDGDEDEKKKKEQLERLKDMLIRMDAERYRMEQQLQHMKQQKKIN